MSEAPDPSIKDVPSNDGATDNNIEASGSTTTSAGDTNTDGQPNTVPTYLEGAKEFLAIQPDTIQTQRLYKHYCYS